MPDRAVLILAFLAAIGSGLVAGVLFAFSSFVMAALARIPPEQGIAAMQSINVTVINPGFMLAFMGTGVLCLALLLAAYQGWGRPGSILVLAASLLYLIGCIGVTAVGNVPLNDALGGLRPGTSEAGLFWATFLARWTWWNHARTVAALLAAVLFTAALVRRANP